MHFPVPNSTDKCITTHNRRKFSKMLTILRCFSIIAERFLVEIFELTWKKNSINYYEIINYIYMNKIYIFRFDLNNILTI